MVCNKQSFGEKIVLNYLSSIKIPITKAELVEKYGEKIIAIELHREKRILLKDLFIIDPVQVFYSKSEIAVELNKIYSRLRRGIL